MMTGDQKFSDDDQAYMKVALSLARRGLGSVAPNPAVGCILVKDGHIIARGWTATGGRPHAEAVALDRAAGADGATAYVTLEPCAHHGKTPPCAEALVQAGVKKVFVATCDPDPRVSGRGIRILEKAGIDVKIGLMKEESGLVNQGFFLKIKEKRPMVTVKIASSQDGKIAGKRGVQTWITSPEARRRGHLYRAENDAIMIGIGTALIDDPTLDCRITGLESQSPIRILLDTNLKIKTDSNLCKTAASIPLWVMTASTDEVKKETLRNVGAKIYQIDTDHNNQLDLMMLMNVVAEKGVTRVLCEGGAKLNASLIRASLIDRLVWFRSPDSFGDAGVSALEGIDINELDRSLRSLRVDHGRIGPDQWQEYEINTLGKECLLELLPTLEK